MKRYILFVAAITMLLLASCQKQITSEFRGNYSFKTSGVLYATEVLAPDSQEKPRELTIKLPAESGQMDITPRSSDKNEDQVFITMNVTAGDIVVLRAKIKDATITIEPHKRTFVFNNVIEGSTIPESAEANVTVSGEGKRYDNIILFSFDYSGSIKIGDTEYKIHDSEVDSRAKLNE